MGVSFLPPSLSPPSFFFLFFSLSLCGSLESFAARHNGFHPEGKWEGKRGLSLGPPFFLFFFLPFLFPLSFIGIFRDNHLKKAGRGQNGHWFSFFFFFFFLSFFLLVTLGQFFQENVKALFFSLFFLLLWAFLGFKGPALVEKISRFSSSLLPPPFFPQRATNKKEFFYKRVFFSFFFFLSPSFPPSHPDSFRCAWTSPVGREGIDKNGPHPPSPPFSFFSPPFFLFPPWITGLGGR